MADKFNYPEIIQQNQKLPNAYRTRQLMRWRVPGLGFVDMYINPQSFEIKQKKVISSQRTKGGYIVQYYGEELPIITINGTTGSSSIEGINVLEKVYRSEQEAFQQVSATLTEQFQNYFSLSGVSGLIGQSSGNIASNILNSALGGTANPPVLPTLGSLAFGVELYYQGWCFKGYFTDFNITESVNNGIGVFNYNLTFIVLDRRGTRNNFMSWSRMPANFDENGNPTGYYKSDSKSTPPNFKGEGK